MLKTLPILKQCTDNITPCGWNEFLTLIDELIKFAIYIAVVAATLTIAYGGLKMLMSGDNAGERSKARSMIWNSILGIIITMVAWLIVQYILKLMGLQPGYSLLAQ